MFRLPLFAAGLLALLALPASSVSSDASFPGRNGRIAFASGRAASELALYTMRADGSVVQRVTRPSPPMGTHPVYSPDGRTIAFASQASDYSTELWLGPTHGGRPRRLLGGIRSGPPTDLAWSPDGRRLVVEDGGLSVIGVDGRGRRRLDVGRSSYEPDWSPDGRRIAYAHRPSGIFVLDLRTGRNRRVSYGGQPAWSPDGKRIAFSHATCGVCPYRIYVMDADGGHVRKLTSGTSDQSDGGPAWSPDGRLIAYHTCCDRLPNVDDVGGAIYVVRPDGSERRRLFIQPDDVENPAWNPNGKRIAFDVQDSTLWVMDSDGKRARPFFSRRPGPDTNPKWAPDGRRIAFTRTEGLYLVNASGSGLRKLGPEFGVVSWAPDGKRMAVENGGDGIDILSVTTGRTREILVDEGAGDTSKFSPAWSPDGKWIAYLDGDADGDGNVSLYSLRTGKSRHLRALAAGELSWSPDGKQLTYTFNGVRVLNLGTRHTRLLVRNGSSASWSPDGRLIAFVRKVGGNAEIYLIDPSGRHERRLTRSRGPDLTPDWQRLP